MTLRWPTLRHKGLFGVVGNEGGHRFTWRAAKKWLDR